MQNQDSAFLLIIRDVPEAIYDALSADERRRSMNRWNAWVDEMAANGHVQLGHPLESTGRVVSGKNGQEVLDGPFAEAKELVGGFFLLRAASLNAATALAQKCPNLQYGMKVEVRPIATSCHVARSLGWEGMRDPAEA